MNFCPHFFYGSTFCLTLLIATSLGGEPPRGKPAAYIIKSRAPSVIHPLPAGNSFLSIKYKTPVMESRIKTLESCILGIAATWKYEPPSWYGIRFVSRRYTRGRSPSRQGDSQSIELSGFSNDNLLEGFMVTSFNFSSAAGWQVDCSYAEGTRSWTPDEFRCQFLPTGQFDDHSGELGVYIGSKYSISVLGKEISVTDLGMAVSVRNYVASTEKMRSTAISQWLTLLKKAKEAIESDSDIQVCEHFIYPTRPLRPWPKFPGSPVQSQMPRPLPPICTAFRRPNRTERTNETRRIEQYVSKKVKLLNENAPTLFALLWEVFPDAVCWK